MQIIRIDRIKDGVIFSNIGQGEAFCTDDSNEVFMKITASNAVNLASGDESLFQSSTKVLPKKFHVVEVESE